MKTRKKNQFKKNVKVKKHNNQKNEGSIMIEQKKLIEDDIVKTNQNKKLSVPIKRCLPNIYIFLFILYFKIL